MNGTLNPYFDAPAQVVRFRLLNGSSLRSFNFGLISGSNKKSATQSYVLILLFATELDKVLSAHTK